MQKFLSVLLFFPLLLFSLDFQAETWDKNGNACLGTSKGDYVYIYNPQVHKLLIYKVLRPYPGMCLGAKWTRKIYAYRIVYDQLIPIRILKCGKILIVEDLELGTKQVLNFEKVIPIGKWKHLKLKKAFIEPKILKSGKYFWYGVSYVIENQEGNKPTLTPLEIPPSF